jgi:DNA-binding transcriptional ArsR family regulator
MADDAEDRRLLSCHRMPPLIVKQMLHQQPALDLMFQALADPARRGMVERLSRGPASVSELARPLDMSLSAVVQHLQVLEASGLVRSEKVGRVRTCRIEPVALRAAEAWFAGRRAIWERRLDRLADYLGEGSGSSGQGSE